MDGDRPGVAPFVPASPISPRCPGPTASGSSAARWATVVAGRLEGFDYARPRAGQRATGAFAAYALDRVVTVY